MKKKIIQTLGDLMKYKTIEGNSKDFDRAFDYIKKEVSKTLFLVEYKFKNQKALVISNVKEKVLDIIFCTHIDIVPADNYEMKISDDVIFGRGTFDMKGSLSVLLNLFNNLKTDKKVALFITSDEEVDGYSAMKLLKIYKTNLAIIPDGGSNFDLIVEEKGLLQLKLSIKTKAAHAAELYKGENALIKLIKIYEELIIKYPLPKSETEYITSINLSKLEGGDALNKVPDYGEMILDIRYTSKDNVEDIINYIKSLNKKVVVQTIGFGPLFKTKINEEIKRYIKICEMVLRKEIQIKTSSMVSDAVYFSNLNIPTIIMNPVGGNAHGPEEYVTLSSLIKLYKIYEKFLKKEVKK